MKKLSKTLLTFCLISFVGVSSAEELFKLPTGVFRGNSDQIFNDSLFGFTGFFKNNAMALFIENDEVTGKTYAILAEYERLPMTNFTRTTAVRSWVNRLYAFKVEQEEERKNQFNLIPLAVSAQGQIYANREVPSSSLSMPAIVNQRPWNGLSGAVVRIYDRENPDPNTAEIIKFRNGTHGSTWRRFVPANYMGTKRTSGLDYFRRNKFYNAKVSPDLYLHAEKFQDYEDYEKPIIAMASFSLEEQEYGLDIFGSFIVREKARRFFSFEPIKNQKSDAVNIEEVSTKIGIFIDVMDWTRAGFMTNELFLINPDDPSDVGFFYESKATTKKGE